VAVNVVNTTRQHMVNQVSTDIGATGIMRIWAGSKPANPSTADPASTNKIAEYTLGATAFASAAGAEGASVTAALNGTPLTATVGNTGTPSFFRLYTSAGTCIMQGDIPADLTVTPSGSITAGATLTVSSYSISESA
jgi:hypothetical protein